MHAAILRYFAVVARTGSIRRASQELNVASSAISRQIQKLEDSFGQVLFERLPGGLRLTAAGRVVLEHAERTLHDFALLRGALGELAGQRTGTVAIASLDSLLVTFLPEQLARFNAANTAVDFLVRSASHPDIVSMVAEGATDIGITFNLPHPDDLEFTEDVAMPVMAMVGPGHPLAGRAEVTLEECSRHDLLLHFDGAVFRSLIEVQLSALERGGRVLMRSNNLVMHKAMVMQGAGIAFFTPIGMMEEILTGQIVAIPLKGTQLDRLRIGLLLSRRRQLTPAVRALAEQLGAALAALRLPGVPGTTGG